MEINYAMGEVSLKIVFYGPGLSGKTTNLEVIHAKTPEIHRGRLTTISTQQDRTLFFDFMPLDLGQLTVAKSKLKVKLRLFTVPGQAYYNTTRKIVLQRVDGVVFVADSQRSKKQENIESLQNLRENLAEQGVDIHTVPLVLQYNKRDLPNGMSLPEMNADLNADLRVSTIPAVAVTGEGVFLTIKTIAELVLKSVENQVHEPGGRTLKSPASLLGKAHVLKPQSEIVTSASAPQKGSMTDRVAAILKNIKPLSSAKKDELSPKEKKDLPKKLNF